jgi:hypothetical protein
MYRAGMSDGLETSRRRARRNVVLTAAIGGLGGRLFCWRLVPETKGKPLEDSGVFPGAAEIGAA